MEPRGPGKPCVPMGGAGPRFESHPASEVDLGGLRVARALPVRDRRIVSAWCFLDRFGPITFSTGRPMDIPAHPHIGLQTVTWILEGEVVHDDSLRSEAVARPGTVNVMTAGDGIAHAEWTPDVNGGRLNGVQLWIALPEAHRRRAAAFQHVPDVPVVELDGGMAQVFAGSFAGALSPARHFSEVMGVDLRVHPRSTLNLPLEGAHEHAVVVLDGDCSFDGQPLTPEALHYLGTHRKEANFTSRKGGRILLIGGPPFPERVLMWWNFVARTPEEIADARADWVEGRRFGDVTRHSAPRLEAPPLARFARANPAS